MTEIVDSIILDFAPLAAQLRAAADRLEGKATYVGGGDLVQFPDLTGLINATAERIEIKGEAIHGGEPLAPKAEIDSVIDDLNAHTKAYAEDHGWDAIHAAIGASREARIREIVREEIANSPALKRSEGAREAFKEAAKAWSHGQPSAIAEGPQSSAAIGSQDHHTQPPHPFDLPMRSDRKCIHPVRLLKKALPALLLRLIGSRGSALPSGRGRNCGKTYDSPTVIGVRRITEAGGESIAPSGGTEYKAALNEAASLHQRFRDSWGTANKADLPLASAVSPLGDGGEA